MLIAAFLVAAPTSPPVESAIALDQRCFRLMAELAEEDDPRARALGRIAAQYFLGRIDSAVPSFDAATALEGESIDDGEREALLGRCGDAMQAGGRDFAAIGRALAPRERPGT